MDHVARGQNGIVTFDGVTVAILRTGMSRVLAGSGEKLIPIAAVGAVQMRPAGPLISGFIRFAPAGEQQSRLRTDEYSVVFGRSQATAFTHLGRAVEAAITPALSGPAAGAAGTSVADELTKLARLVELELLTRDEFEVEKARLLGLPSPLGRY